MFICKIVTEVWPQESEREMIKLLYSKLRVISLLTKTLTFYTAPLTLSSRHLEVLLF